MQARLAPTRHPSTLDIAWAAGIYEGEGYCTILKSKKDGYKGQTQQVVIAQKDPELLHRLRENFGGAIYSIAGKHPHFRWSVTGPRARGFLMTVFTFLTQRRKKQALLTLRPDRS